MAASPAMQRKAVAAAGLGVVAVGAVAALRRLLRRLTAAGDERRQPVNVAVVVRLLRTTVLGRLLMLLGRLLVLLMTVARTE